MPFSIVGPWARFYHICKHCIPKAIISGRMTFVETQRIDTIMSSLSMIGTTGDERQVLLLKEGTSQTRGREALNNNIAAAKIVASVE